MSAEENKVVARRFHDEIFQRGRLGVADEICAPNFVWHSAANPPGLPAGPAGVKQMATMMRTGLPDLSVTHDDSLADADRVVIRWSARGTHTGELFGIPPTGKPIRVTGIDIFRVSNGKLVELWQNWDQLGMLQQLGVVPTAEQAQAMPPHPPDLEIGGAMLPG